MLAAKTNGDGNQTGFGFEGSRFHGKVWTVPDDAEGRPLAQIIEGELEKIGAKPATVPESAR